MAAMASKNRRDTFHPGISISLEDMLNRFILCIALQCCSHIPDKQILEQGGKSVAGDLYPQRAGIYVDSSHVKYGTRFVI